MPLNFCHTDIDSAAVASLLDGEIKFFTKGLIPMQNELGFFYLTAHVLQEFRNIKNP